jgi:hypothetical protein
MNFKSHKQMIAEIKEWYNDIRFPEKECHVTSVQNVYWWSRKHMARIDLIPDVKEWLTENVQGRFMIHHETIDIGPQDDPMTYPCFVSFSRATDAIAFKLAFA